MPTEIERLDARIESSRGVRSGQGSYMASAALLRRLWPEIKAVVVEAMDERDENAEGDARWKDDVCCTIDPPCAICRLDAAIRRELGDADA